MIEIRAIFEGDYIDCTIVTGYIFSISLTKRLTSFDLQIFIDTKYDLKDQHNFFVIFLYDSIRNYRFTFSSL